MARVVPPFRLEFGVREMVLRKGIGPPRQGPFEIVSIKDSAPTTDEASNAEDKEEKVFSEMRLIHRPFLGHSVVPIAECQPKTFEILLDPSS